MIRALPGSVRMAIPAPASKLPAESEQTPPRREFLIPKRSRPALHQAGPQLPGPWFPVRSAKSLRRRLVPLRGIGILPGGFKILRQLERHHGVPRLLKEIRKLPRRIFAGARSADAGGNLFPVGHFLLAL